MDIKFFPRDVIGRKPKKIGDKFKAQFVGGTSTFKVTYIDSNMYMAEMAQ